MVNFLTRPEILNNPKPFLEALMTPLHVAMEFQEIKDDLLMVTSNGETWCADISDFHISKFYPDEMDARVNSYHKLMTKNMCTYLAKLYGLEYIIEFLKWTYSKEQNPYDLVVATLSKCDARTQDAILKEKDLTLFLNGSTVSFTDKNVQDIKERVFITTFHEAQFLAERLERRRKENLELIESLIEEVIPDDN